MEADPQLDFSCIVPSRYSSFSFPSPDRDMEAHPLHVAVLDSPFPPESDSSPLVAAMFVPAGRNKDWIFCTSRGHLHLLLSSPTSLSRLILVFHSESCPRPFSREEALMPLLLALAPESSFRHNTIPDIPFLSYDDGVVQVTEIATLVGPVVGDMVVEDVVLEREPAHSPELRRRIRFKRMPNLVQSQIHILPGSVPDPTSLVQPYLTPMVAALSLLGENAQPRCLCVGVGGGALLMFLKRRLGFEVVGVEIDSVVVDVAKMYFGLAVDEFLRIRVGDGIEMLEDLAHQDEYLGSFDAAMVDLDSVDVMARICAPPREFVKRNVLLSLRSILRTRGIAVVNVVCPPMDRTLLDEVTLAFQSVFDDLYQLDVGNGENVVLIAQLSIVGDAVVRKNCQFLEKLKEFVGPTLIDRIKKV